MKEEWTIDAYRCLRKKVVIRGFEPTREGTYDIIIQARPQYCDRGDWIIFVEGENNDIDGADGFPRYFFGTEAEVKAQMETWLGRRHCYRQACELDAKTKRHHYQHGDHLCAICGKEIDNPIPHPTDMSNEQEHDWPKSPELQAVARYILKLESDLERVKRLLPPPEVKLAIRVLLGHVEAGWANSKWVVAAWLEKLADADAGRTVCEHGNVNPLTCLICYPDPYKEYCKDEPAP